MKFPKNSITMGRKLYRASLVDGLLDPAKVRAITQQMITEKPRHYIATLRYLQKLVRLETQSRSVTVESATPLDAAQQQQILSTLAQQYGQGLTSEFKINTALIGGTRIQVGSDVYDGSVAGRLTRLKENFAK